VRSSGDFDSLDALESGFLSHRLVSQVTDKLANKKKKLNFKYLNYLNDQKKIATFDLLNDHE
jgi:hypothetical protein